MKSFRIEYVKTVKHTITLTAKNEKDALRRFEPLCPENARILDVAEVDRSAAEVDA